MTRKSVAALSLAVLAGATSLPAFSAGRLFVASFGSDANNCFLATPCRTFQVAHNAVDPGGEVVALDAAGYAPLTITKSVTITANPGFYAGIAAASGNAVTIATAGVNVILRGLNINGGTNSGVVMTNGASLSIENCVISNFTDTGVNISTPASVRISDTLVRGNNVGIVVTNGATLNASGVKVLGNTNVGIHVFTGTATTTTATISDSISAQNLLGFAASSANDPSAIARMSVTRSTATENQQGITNSQNMGTSTIIVSYSQVTYNSSFGLLNVAGGTMVSHGNNTVRGNGTDTVGVITTVPGT